MVKVELVVEENPGDEFARVAGRRAVPVKYFLPVLPGQKTQGFLELRAVRVV